MTNFDVIIIGSGFGGAVSACRLAEAGKKVLVLERGRRWSPEDYPRGLDDAWIWDQDEPQKQNGWIDLRFMDDMWVVQGAAVGGGSHIYANVSIEAKPETFKSGWPNEISYTTLKPYYDRVGDMLNVQTLPDNQLTERYKLMREGAENIGHGDRFMAVPLAVSFNENWNYDLVDCHNNKHSHEWVNAQGQKQGTCIHCGNCDIGCQVRAKNTLDLNYLPLAEKHGAEIRPLHLVYNISQDKGRNGGRYVVHFNRIDNGQLIPGYVSAPHVIVAAGSLGSTELLLRAKSQYKSLPDISPFLGRNWSSNGDFLTPATYKNRRVSPSRGPTISSAIDFLDGSEGGKQFFIEDGGFPNVLHNYVQSAASSTKSKYRLLARFLQEIVPSDPLAEMMPWFGQAVDAADGRLYLGREWYAPWRRKLKLDWDVTRSEDAINAMINMHKRLTAATGGETFVPPTWTVLKNLVTPHALGGCSMGTTRIDGVVDHKGEVFSYPGLYVADGAIVPRAIGLNPSRTIAALAERNAELMLQTS